MDKGKIPSVVVKPDIYEKMLKSAITLRNHIRQKNEDGLGVTKEEADFVNDFEAYTTELFAVMKEQEND